MKKSWFNADFVKLMQLLIKTPLDNRWFKVRKQFNLEKAQYLNDYKPFQKEVIGIRKELGIPKLNPDKDYKNVTYRGLDIEDSEWILSRSDDFINHYETIISNLLIKYNLPASFKDWVDWYILYDKPKHTPLYFMELINTFISNPEEAQRTPLTTQEKQFVKFMIKGYLQLNKLSKKDTPVELKQLLATVAKSKNRNRPTRTLKSALKTLKVGTVYRELDEAEYVKRNRKRTYEDIVPTIFSEDEELKQGAKRLSARLRQQKRRLLLKHTSKT